MKTFYTLKCWKTFPTDISILFREIPKNEILLNTVRCLISMSCTDRCHVQKQISEHRQITWFTLGFGSMTALICLKLALCLLLCNFEAFFILCKMCMLFLSKLLTISKVACKVAFPDEILWPSQNQDIYTFLT